MKWVDKAFGIKKLMEHFLFELDDILFIGDAVFPGGNDYPPFTIGVDSIKTDGVEHTKEIIRRLIDDEDLEDEWLYGE